MLAESDSSPESDSSQAVEKNRVAADNTMNLFHERVQSQTDLVLGDFTIAL